MKIIYPYNEILPKRSAHDVYVARNCAALAEAGCEVRLLCGAGSLSPASLDAHYQLSGCSRLCWQTLPILRKNFGLPFTCNQIFFWGSQYWIRRSRPDWVFVSVRKQGEFHMKRKVPGAKYLYEVHELAWYPGVELNGTVAQLFERERRMLSSADIVTVTTEALKEILQAPPYALEVPVAVVPLASDFEPVPAASPFEGELQLMYVGQMYKGQGVELLLEALARTSKIRLTLVGGKSDELAYLRQLALSLGVEDRICFAGLQAPAAIPGLVAGAHALVAPFSDSGRMPFVAHTKLVEYAAWQRPVVAPELPVTREHLRPGSWVSFIPDDVNSLAGALQSLTSASFLNQLQVACRRNRVLTWKERSERCLELLSTL